MPFDGNANDETGNGYNGTINGASLVADQWGTNNSAYSFNGTSNYIDLAKSLPEKDTITLAFWFKPNAGSTRNYIFWEGDNECGNDYAVYVTDNIISVNASKKNKQLDGNSTTTGLYNLSSSLNNTWHCFIWSMTPNESKVYIDNILLVNFQKSGSIKYHHYNISLGSMNDGNGGNCGSPRQFYYKGLLDNVRAYGKVLSTNEMNQVCSSSQNYIENAEKKSSFGIFPAYIKSTEQITITNNLKLLIKSVSVFDLSGKRINFEINSSDSQILIPIDHLSHGLYFIAIATSDQTITTKVFIE